MAASLGALPVLWPTVTTFSFDPFWVATYSSQNQLPSPVPHELLVDLGPTLAAGRGRRCFVLRGRVAPFGLVLWVLLGLIAMYLPVPYQRRLSFGIQPALAVLAAQRAGRGVRALDARRAAALRLGVVAGAASGTRAGAGQRRRLGLHQRAAAGLSLDARPGCRRRVARTARPSQAT